MVDQTSSTTGISLESVSMTFLLNGKKEKEIMKNKKKIEHSSEQKSSTKCDPQK